MKVLVFTNLWPSSVARGHGSFVQERVLRLQQRLGFDLEVVHPLPLYPRLLGRSLAAPQSRLPDSDVADGLRVHYPRYFHVPRFGVGRQALRMQRGCREVVDEVMRRFEPDLVDAHYLYPDACAAIELGAVHGKPVLATARGSDVNVLGEVEAVRAQFRVTLRRARRVMAVSQALARRLETVADLEPGSVLTMRNGVDLERFRVGTTSPELRVVCVARLAPIKGIATLIRAMAHVRDEAHLDLIGGGGEEKDFRALVAELGLTARVRVLGELGRDEVARELLGGGVFALASRNEGWPNALMEALASGCFAVVSKVGGMPEVLGGPDVGAGVAIDPAADAATWGRALDAALERLAVEGRGAGASARARAEALSWDATLDSLAAVFEEATT